MRIKEQETHLRLQEHDDDDDDDDDDDEKVHENIWTMQDYIRCTDHKMLKRFPKIL